MIIDTHCPQCGSQSSQKLYSKTITALDFGWEELLKSHSIDSFTYSIKQCNNCGLSYRDARFTDAELNILYGRIQNSKETPDYSHYWGRSKEINKYIKETSNIEIKDMKILDIGGGNGEICDWFASHRNCECDIFDFGDIRKTIKKNLQLVERIPDDSKYDLIMLNHVLEHVNKPLDFLSKYLQYTHNNSLIYLEVPYELFHYHILKTKGHYEHINYFGQTSTSNLIHLLGYKPIKVSLKMGFGNSIPVISAIFQATSSPHKSNPIDFKLFNDVITPTSIWLLIASKIKQKLKLVDKSHKQ